MMEKIIWSCFAIAAFLVLSLCPTSLKGDNDWDLDEDTGGWVDPHSMLETKPFKKTSFPEREVIYETCEKVESDCSAAEKSLTECGDQVTKLKKDLEKQKELYRKSETTASKEQPFFEQYLRHILGLFTKVQDGADVGHYEAAISLSGLNYGYLSSYVANQNVSVQEVHSILLKLMTNVRWVREELNEFDDGLETSFAAQVLYCLNVAGAVSVVMVALLQAVSVLRRVRMSLGRFVSLLLVATILASFIISIPWTWWHLYKKKVAERMASMSKGSPDCSNGVNSFWRTILSHFYIQKDECQAYFEQLEIDPLWEVPPTQAVAVTFVRFFLEPVKHVGQAIRELMVSAFEDLPIFLWIPVFAFIILLVILMFFCFGRYRISSPFLSIEPARFDDAHQVAALQDRVDQLQLENRDMRRQLALPDARGNAVVDDRGDRTRAPPPLEEPPARVQDVERHDGRTTEKNKSVKMLEDTKSASSVKTLEKNKSTSPVKILEETKSASSVKTLEKNKSTSPVKTTDKNKSTSPLAPRTEKDVPADIECVETLSSLCSTAVLDKATPVSVMGKPIREETNAKFVLGNPPTASYTEPNAELQNLDLSDERLETNGEDFQQSFVVIETTEDIRLIERR